jgi:hypothetical protein
LIEAAEFTVIGTEAAIAAIKMAFIRQQASLAHEYKTNITCFWSIAN